MTTKYNIGDEVFALTEEGPVKGTISKILTDGENIIYTLDVYYGEVDLKDAKDYMGVLMFSTNTYEKYVFPTKEALLNSLPDKKK